MTRERVLELLMELQESHEHAPNGTMVAASNQAMLGSTSASLASGSSIRKFLNLPYDTKPSSSSAPSALQPTTLSLLISVHPTSTGSTAPLTVAISC